MPNAAASPDRRGTARGWAGPALVALAILTLLRIAALAVTPMELFVDEAQYWLWGQEPAFGYYSKPPMIGWLIGAVTWAAGSDSPFWIRLPAPILHMVTAMILGAIAARLWSARAALFVALAYATLPMVGVGSALISTDTVMFPFLAGALWAWLAACRSRAPGLGALAGALLGGAFLAKYAALYFLIGAALAALSPDWRPRLAVAAAALLAFALVIAPNIVWNASHGFSTLQHTLDNADWVREPGKRAGFDALRVLGFLGAQFAVFGPVLAGALVAILVAGARRAAASPLPLLLAFTLPPLVLVSAQAALGGAYANWAASAYLAGTVATVPWLLARSRAWLGISFLLNGAIALAFLLALPFADRITWGGKDRLAFERYLGRAELSAALIDRAKAEGIATVVSANRDILADLFYTGRDSGLDFRAAPEKGRPDSHYALKFPLDPASAQDVLYATPRKDVPPCATGGAMLGRIEPQRGAWRGKTISLYRVPADCWNQS